MKKQFIFLFFLFISTLSFAQSSLDSLRLLLPLGHTDDLNCIRISKDGNYIATANILFPFYIGSLYAQPSDYNVLIWNNNGVVLHSLNHESMIYHLSDFIPGTSYIAASTLNDTRIWDTSNGNLIASFNVGYQTLKVLNSNTIIALNKGATFKIDYDNTFSILDFYNIEFPKINNVVIPGSFIYDAVYNEKKDAIILITDKGILEYKLDNTNPKFNPYLRVKDDFGGDDILVKAKRLDAHNQKEVLWIYEDSTQSGVLNESFYPDIKPPPLINNEDLKWNEKEQILTLKNEKGLIIYDAVTGNHDLFECSFISYDLHPILNRLVLWTGFGVEEYEINCNSIKEQINLVSIGAYSINKPSCFYDTIIDQDPKLGAKTSFLYYSKLSEEVNLHFIDCDSIYSINVNKKSASYPKKNKQISNPLGQYRFSLNNIEGFTDILEFNKIIYRDNSLYNGWNGFRMINLYNGITKSFYNKTILSRQVTFDNLFNKLYFGHLDNVIGNLIKTIDLNTMKTKVFSSIMDEDFYSYDKMELNMNSSLIFAENDKSILYNLSNGKYIDAGGSCSNYNPSKWPFSIAHSFHNNTLYTLYDSWQCPKEEYRINITSLSNGELCQHIPKTIRASRNYQFLLKPDLNTVIAARLENSEERLNNIDLNDTLYILHGLSDDLCDCDISYERNSCAEKYFISDIDEPWYNKIVPPELILNGANFICFDNLLSFEIINNMLVILSQNKKGFNYLQGEDVSSIENKEQYELWFYKIDDLKNPVNSITLELQKSENYKIEELTKNKLLIRGYNSYLLNLINFEYSLIQGEFLDFSNDQHLIAFKNHNDESSEISRNKKSNITLYSLIDFSKFSEFETTYYPMDYGNIYKQERTMGLFLGKTFGVNSNLGLFVYNFFGDYLFGIHNLSDGKSMVTLQNGFYMCDKEISKSLNYYESNAKIIGFDQLDPVYNRPDIVLDSIGKYFGVADQELVANYRQSWEKRIDRLGLDKEKLGKGEIAVPNAEIVGADAIAYENKAGKLNIKVSANDPKYPLRRFNVYVNEVPLYGSAGISIAHLKKQVWDTTVSVPLSVGENKIQVSVMNELGLENFKYPTYVNYTPENNIVAKTHYIGIGVNEFKEPGHKLNYCVKDVRDLAREFATENKNVDTLLFTDKQVTKENILALKAYLNKTSVNDKVIISCSSHGLLDDSLNFYLAMHDVDFNNPKARGLKYEELESLLDGIPARQKLLLLDACNSGENDKTEVLKQELQQKEKNMDSSQVLAARGVIIKLEEENKSNFKKMNELFVNVRNNTGSVIISAAGGQESALEAIEVDGKTIENGAFTYSILECLKQNKGKELKVNTLKQYAEKRVEEITNGEQKPTSRQETMEVDWRVR